MFCIDSLWEKISLQAVHTVLPTEALPKAWDGEGLGTGGVQITFQLLLTPDKLKSEAKTKISEYVLEWNWSQGFSIFLPKRTKNSIQFNSIQYN